MTRAWYRLDTCTFFFKLKKIKKKSQKSQNDTWQLLFTSVNYFNGVSEKDQIEKKFINIRTKLKKKSTFRTTLKKPNDN